MERLTVGTHQGHCIMQAGALLLLAKKIIPPNSSLLENHLNVLKGQMTPEIFQIFT